MDQTIVNLVDRTPHKLYVELTGREPVVLMNKRPSRIEFLNDRFGTLVEIAEEMMDRGKREGFLQSVSQQHVCWCSGCREETVSHPTKMLAYLLDSLLPGAPFGVEQDTRVLRALDDIPILPAVLARLFRAQLEDKQDVVELARAMDTPGTLFFADRPDEPQRVLDALLDLNSKFILRSGSELLIPDGTVSRLEEQWPPRHGNSIWIKVPERFFIYTRLPGSVGSKATRGLL